MRAREFLGEASQEPNPTKRQKQSTRGLHKFRDKDFADRFYELNRVMMAAATTDGTFVPDIDGESWAGRHDIAVPYTQEESDKLERAYEATGAWHKDLNRGDMRSQELETTNKISPIKGFKGYAK